MSPRWEPQQQGRLRVRLACGCWRVATAAMLTTSLTVCAGGDRQQKAETSSPSVPVPAEELAVTAPVTRVLAPHALELGEPPTLVIVIDGVPSSLRPGVEVQATGSVRVFRAELGAELGIPLSGWGLESFEGSECLVVASLVLPDRAETPRQ